MGPVVAVILLLACVGGAQVPASPLGPPEADRADATSWVNQLAQEKRPRWVKRHSRRAGRPGSIYAASWRPGHEKQGRALAHATLYAVDAELHPAAILNFHQAVVWTNRGDRPVDELVLRFLPGVDPDRISGLQVRLDGVEIPAKLDGSRLVVHMAPGVRPNAQARIEIRIDSMGIPPLPPIGPDLPERVNALDIGAFGRSRGVTNLGYWLPLVTPLRADGSFDERPLPKNGEHSWFEPANFHVVLRVPPGLKVATTGVKLDEWSEGEHRILRFVAAGVREFTVKASTEFAVTEQEQDGMRVRVWHRRDEPQVGEDLLSYALDALAYFEGRWGPLPFRELDLVDAPIRVAVGMEYPQLVSVATRHLPRPYRASEEHRYTVAHEIAHQWWYGEVGSDPVEEPWLDEALTVQSTLMYAEHREGAEGYRARRERELIEPYTMWVEGGVPMLPADLPAPQYDLRQYSVLIYGKAALFLDEVRHLLGERAWDEAMRRYHRRYRMKNATGEDLLSILRAMEPREGEVDRLYRLWMEEVHHYDALLNEP